MCNQTVDHAWAQYSALGYSGTNSGGTLLIEHSQFDHNEEGVDTPKPRCPRKQGDRYPRRNRVIMHPLPKGVPTMPNPCIGVPANPWCPARKH